MTDMLANQKEYLLSCQLPSGTFRLGPKSDQINPYFANLALVSLVRLGEWKAVQRHVDWYLHHLNEDGYVNDFRLVAGTEIDTGKADSEDSYHATLFSLLAEMVRASGELNWLSPSRQVLWDLVQGIVALQQKDGLTWAKRSYRVKYLMDNCEVAKGLEDAAYLFFMLGDDRQAKEATRLARFCRSGIQSLYSQRRQSYAMYDNRYPGWRKWYPDVTSQAFPIVYGLAGPEETQLLYGQITSAFPHFATFQTGDLYPWMVMGECARLTGDWKRVETMLATAIQLYIQGPRLPYWLIHEAGRFIELLLATGYVYR